MLATTKLFSSLYVDKETVFLEYSIATEFSEMKIKLSENKHLMLEAASERDDLAKVDFRNDISI